MRDSNFGNREPSHSGSTVNSDSQHGVKTQHESVGQPDTGSSKKHLKASQAIQERVRQRRVNAAQGRNDGRPAYKASHTKNPYAKSGE